MSHKHARYGLWVSADLSYIHSTISTVGLPPLMFRATTSYGKLTRASFSISCCISCHWLCGATCSKHGAVSLPNPLTFLSTALPSFGGRHECCVQSSFSSFRVSALIARLLTTVLLQIVIIVRRQMHL